MSDPTPADAELASAQARIDRLPEEVPGLASVEWGHEIIGGPAADASVRVAVTEHADEIVIGTRGVGRARALLGSVAHDVLHRALRRGRHPRACRRHTGRRREPGRRRGRVVNPRILVALDPDGPAPEAEQLALALARATGAELILGTVFPIIDVHSRVDTRHYERLLREEAERFLAARADTLRSQAGDVSIATHAIGSYSAGRGLHRLADDEQAGLVVLGPSRRGRAGRVVPGPMAGRLAHDAPCPVAVACVGYDGGRLSRIGVAYAPTADGHEALRAAASLAVRSEASLEVIAVAAPLPWMDLIAPRFDGTALDGANRLQVAHELEAAVAGLPESLVVEAKALAGDPVELIASATEHVDLLICGSRGYGAVGSVVLGSVAHALLGIARCPVLVVPRGAERLLEQALEHGVRPAAWD